MAMTTCGECGHSVSDKAISCPGCGAPLAVSTGGLREPKNRSTAILLALFLGGLGIHKFYLNQPGWGLLYLLFCWTFIPAVLGVIEALVFLAWGEETFRAWSTGQKKPVVDTKVDELGNPM